jgi:hypothetical protein
VETDEPHAPFSFSSSQELNGMEEEEEEDEEENSCLYFDELREERRTTKMSKVESVG